jgi:predicted neutral ceramidase superfamily lipid hydrolase
MTPYNIILGLILLVFGLKLFWLFVAVAGFLSGMLFGDLLLPDQAQWIRLLVAVGAGVLGALLAVLAQRVAFALAGFYGGAYLALILAQSLGGEGRSMLLFVVAGVIGAIIATLIMDRAIIVISSLVGAGVVVEALPLGQGVRILIFMALVAAGILVQERLLPRSKASHPSAR